jgi:hypothetical protein
MFTRRAVLAFVALFVAGCSKTGDVDFTITKVFSQANGNPVNSVGGGTSYTSVQHADLASEAGGAWGHRDKIKSIELVGLDATLDHVNAGGGAGTLGSGHITLTRGASSAIVGSWAGEPLVAAPHSINVVLNGAAMSIVEDAMRNDGVFDVTFAGSTNNAINFDATVSLHLKMHYKINVP